ncbi:MAG: hypothetical protein ACI4VF_03580 [Lachnospirales bacterium]
MATKKETEAVANNTTVPETAVSKFTKKQLKESKRFSKYRDVLGVVLEDSKDYSIDECQSLIDDFMNKPKKKGSGK